MKLVETSEAEDLAAMLRDVFTAQDTVSLTRGLRRKPARADLEPLWSALTGAGVLGLPFAEKYGGSGGTLTHLATVFTEAGRALCPTAMGSTLQFGVALDALGSDDQRARHVAALCAGRLLGTVALWNPADAGDIRPGLVAEPGSGGDLREGVRASGTLEFVTDAAFADVVLAGARVRGAGAEPDRTIGLMLDPGADEVRVEPVTALAGGQLYRVTVDDVPVPGVDVLAGDGGGLRPDDLRRAANISVALSCLDMVGGAEAVLRRTVDHTTARHQFGRPLGSFQAAQHLVADMHIRLQAARLASRSAVFWLGRGREAGRETAIARMHAATAYKRITLDAHQLHGGMGYVVETDLHLWSERARVLATLGGTADVATGWLQREVGLVGTA